MPTMSAEQEAFAKEQAFDQGTKVAQVFSGIFFSGLAAWLTLTNGTRLAFVQRASLEKRLTVCCFINTYVGIFSAFFNFFQLTDVDNLILPTQAQFTLDLARPIEWVMTCPLMQLVLVLMGGAKIPEYRRYLMPAFSVLILSCGTASCFMPNMSGRLACYGVGCVVFVVMVSFNRMQIIEHSCGDEGLLQGDSEFRKATLLLIGTWAPFPIWFSLSPEGFGIITNVLLIQVGWAFLNVLAKFTFIFYIQRIKDMYCNRLKTKRELVGMKPKSALVGSGSRSPPDYEFGGGIDNDFESARAYEEMEAERKKEKLGAVVVETMTFLGMAQHTDRFLRLLERAEIFNVDEVQTLTRDDCGQRSLPFDLVSALQRRLRVWKLEMVDDAEIGLERGEEHYIKKCLDLPKPASVDVPPPGQVSPHPHQMMMMPIMPNVVPEQSLPYLKMQQLPLAPMIGTHGMHLELQTPVEDGLLCHPSIDASLEELLQRTEEHILEGQRSRIQTWEKAFEAMASTLQVDLKAMEQRLCQQLGATSKTNEQRGELRAFESRLNARLDEERRCAMGSLEKRVNQQVEQQIAMVSNKMDGCCMRIDACGLKLEVLGQKAEHWGQKVDVYSAKVDTCGAAQADRLDEGLAKLTGQLAELSGQSRSGLDSLSQRVDILQTAQAKLAADAEGGARRRFEELENSMICREDEQEASHKRRFEELLRQSAVRRLDELLAQVQRAGDRGEAAVESLGTALQAELQSVASRLGAKAEGLHAAAVRQHAERESGLQQHLEQAIGQALARGAQEGAQQAAQRAERAVEALDGSLHGRLEELLAQAVAQGAQLGAAQAAQLAEGAVGSLECSLQKRLDDAVSKAVACGAQQGALQSAGRAEKAIEALEGTQRAELAVAMSNLVERVDEIQSAQQRRLSEREERAARRLEELLELTTCRSMQRVDDVGLELKKELHGFAKRLNTKIPFM